LCLLQIKHTLRGRSASSPVINLLNAKLNPICHLLALLEAHHILHVSRIRVKPTEFKSEVISSDVTSMCKLTVTNGAIFVGFNAV